MNNNWMNSRMIGLLFALPMIATAAASAQHFAADSAPLLGDAVATANVSGFTSDRVHTISLNRAGEVEGRIASFGDDNAQVEGLADLKIFFVRDGEIADETKTAKDGTFAVDGLSEGIYSFVATGETGFAAYGVRVIGFEDASKVNVMEAAAVSPNFSAVKSILKKNLPTDVANEIIAVSRDSKVVDRVVGANRVRLNDGQLVGHVMPMLGDVSIVEGTQIHIIQDDQQVAQVEVGKQGSFMVPDLEPGVYDFVAAGPSGFAAVSFQAVDAEVGAISESVLGDSDEIPVAIPAAAQGSGTSGSGTSFGPAAGAIPADIPFDSGVSGGGFVDGGFSDGGFVDGGCPGGCSDSLDVCLTCQQDAGFVGEQIEYAGCDTCGGGEVIYDSSPIEYAGESLGCGCAAGGSGGSFTGGGGIGGGGLLGGGGGGLLGGGLGFRRLGLLAAAIAIPVAVSGGGDADVDDAPGGALSGGGDADVDDAPSDASPATL